MEFFVVCCKKYKKKIGKNNFQKKGDNLIKSWRVPLFYSTYSNVIPVFVGYWFLCDLKRKEQQKRESKMVIAREKGMFWVKVWVTSSIFFRRAGITQVFQPLQSIFHWIRELPRIQISIFFFSIYLFFFVCFFRIVRTIEGGQYLTFRFWAPLKSSIQ